MNLSNIKPLKSSDFVYKQTLDEYYFDYLHKKVKCLIDDPLCDWDNERFGRLLRLLRSVMIEINEQETSQV